MFARAGFIGPCICLQIEFFDSLFVAVFGEGEGAWLVDVVLWCGFIVVWMLSWSEREEYS